MPYKEEDIFGGGRITELIIRWHDRAVSEFESRNTKKFEWLKNLICNCELKCYFLKIKDEEQKILIVDADSEYDIELYVEWIPLTFSYKIKVNKNNKTKLNTKKTSQRDLIEWLSNNYVIEESCKLIFIDIDEPRMFNEGQARIFDRVKQLEILPKTKVENEKEIWEKFIKAQELLTSRNAQPFPIKRFHPLLPIKNEDDKITRYKFKVDLFVDENREYRDIEEELRILNITDQFDEEGDILLKYDDIIRGLDLVIINKFNTLIERERAIVCILQIKPLSTKDKLIKDISERIPDCTFSFDRQKQRISIYYSKTGINKIPDELVLKHNLYRTGIIASVKITESDGDERREFIEQEIPSTSLGSAYEKEKLLFTKSIIEYRKEIFNSDSSINSVKFKIGEYFDIKKSIDGRFTEEFWLDIKRDLYAISNDFKVNMNETTRTLSFEFATLEECISKFKKLESINKFDFALTPDNPDFKFKVKTNLLRQKSEKQIFYERLENLAGVEFHFPLQSDENEGKKNYIPIGKLIASESDMTNLVFSISLWKKEDRRAAKKLIDHIENKRPITIVEANLRGDQAKISWLLQSMLKITNPSDKPNGKPVNSLLGDFIFDSSKAEPIFKNLNEETEDWHDLKKNELLRLNNSQRKAILSALFARDLSLIQGPPGTGKTTVIAELIWQLIRKMQDQKILLTSESNLAVDNALEKLINSEHTIVKPLRFGNDRRFEEEGKKYSYNRIMKWIDENFVPPEYEDVTVDETDDEEVDIISENSSNNAVQIWMNRIAEKALANQNPSYTKPLTNWAIELNNPAKEIKQLFKEKYFKYANVVGNTCSSCGSPSFMKSYQFIFNSKPEFLQEPGKRWNWIPVKFDVVIMDEASKATPPEMLLPLCFGEKSIVIGDHKQLPPMLIEKEFKEALRELRNPRAIQLAEEIDREFVETSQFERLILNPKTDKSIIARLNIQYRMHPKINNVIKQFYTDDTDEGLEPAQELIDNSDKQLVESDFSRFHGFTNTDFIKPDIHTIWVNVDEPEEKIANSRINEKEVEAVKKVLNYLKNSSGFEEYFNHWNNKYTKDGDKLQQEQEIGIISFYGEQVKKLQDVKRYALKELNIPIRLKTVDKFQGMERNIVIVSTVRSNKIKNNGTIEANFDIGFAKAPERLNVALSRARRLLIVVGNLNFFEKYKDKKGNAIYKNAIEIIRQEGLIIDFNKLNRY